ncbi:MAG: RsmB/NOP family class I SAM-dependent RNA methyltransferase [Lachnospiraceae bacterium]
MYPEEFLHRMKNMLGSEWDAYKDTLLEKHHASLRINPFKTEKERFFRQVPWGLEPVPWEPNGFYYDADVAVGKHPYHAAGVYYIQEASAMAPAVFLAAKKGERILDLCAAPGGKTTQIAAAMEGQGILVSNEIHPGRAAILSENVERMGISNCLVINETPAHLAQVFPEYFDRILVDAPCSGEGMFRKNEQAMEEWSVEGVEACAKRQDEILSYAHRMLKPGGRLVYSTCTFSKEEDEGSVERFLSAYPEYELEQVPLCGGICPGFDREEKTIRLFPHKLRGEGHFAAVLRKQGSLEDNSGHGAMQKSLSEKEVQAYREFEDTYLTVRKEGIFVSFGEKLYLAPQGCPDLKGIKVLRPGLQLGTRKKDRFEPAHALAMSLFTSQIKEEYRTGLQAEDPRVAQYLHGQTFSREGKKGWHLVDVDGYSMGWGKLTGSIMKNHYPKGLRTLY